MSINVPWSQEFSDILKSGFQSYSTVASRLLHPYSTDDKTSRLMVKQFSTARDTASSQSYVEKRRGKREIEVTRRRRGGVKKGRDKSSQESVP